MVYEIALAAALTVAAAGDIYDVTLTSIGLKKGLAVEGNTFLIGSKPSTLALYLRDALVLAMCTAPSVVFYAAAHNIHLALGALSAPVVYGVKHLLGGLAWKKLGA